MTTHPEKTDKSQNWYLLASKPKQESRAVENLRNQEITAYSPMLRVERLLKGRRQIVVEPMFTGYIFVKIALDDPNWHRVRSTRGVKDWVRFSGEPAKLPLDIVESLLELESENSGNVKSLMEIGDIVRVESGPFQGLTGIFESADGELRSYILIEFLGKQSRISVENVQLSNNL